MKQNYIKNENNKTADNSAAFENKPADNSAAAENKKTRRKL